MPHPTTRTAIATSKSLLISGRLPESPHSSRFKRLIGFRPYTTGPFKLGASYLNNDIEDTLETDRYTGGVTYTYGPGMSFRGSVSYIDHEVDGSLGGGDADATSVLLGTQINF
jgi:hypothetical protein